MTTANRVQNLDRLAKKLKALPAAARSAMKQALAQGADELVGLQKSLAPVGPQSGEGKAIGLEPGALRDSIVQTWGGQAPKYSAFRSSVVSGDPDLSVIISAGNSDVRDAALVEFGTKPHTIGGKFAGAQHPGTAPQPFFFPPYRALKAKIRGRISRAATASAKQVAAGAST